MEKDLLEELGYRTLDSRLKRISDRIIHDIRAFYKSQELELEPNWYLIFELLKTEEFVTTSMIVQRTKLAQPSIAMIVKKMMQKGYLKSTTDPKDGRIQQLRLTEKAREQLPFFEKIYENCNATIWEILGEDDGILQYLDAIDRRLNERSFRERSERRYAEKYQKEQ